MDVLSICHDISTLPSSLRADLDRVPVEVVPKPIITVLTPVYREVPDSREWEMEESENELEMDAIAERVHKARQKMERKHGRMSFLFHKNPTTPKRRAAALVAASSFSSYC